MPLKKPIDRQESTTSPNDGSTLEVEHPLIFSARPGMPIWLERAV